MQVHTGARLAGREFPWGGEVCLRPEESSSPNPQIGIFGATREMHRSRCAFPHVHMTVVRLNAVESNHRLGVIGEMVGVMRKKLSRRSPIMIHPTKRQKPPN